MLGLKQLHYYPGSHPLAAAAAAHFALVLPRPLLGQLLKNRRHLLDLVAELPKAEPLIEALRNPVNPTPPLGEEWILRWLDTLRRCSGCFRLSAPHWINAKEPVSQARIEMRILVDQAPSDSVPLMRWLQWSSALWRWGCSPPDSGERLKLLATAPPPRREHKASFLAMATGLERVRENWFLESTQWGPLLVVRSGAARQRISQKVTSRTSGFGLTFSKHKVLARGLLEQAGMPVAPGKMVHSEAAALQAAEALGYPLVTKPVEGDQGIGVITRIGSPDALRKAYTLSSGDGQKVLVEKEIPGKDYRFFVVNGSLLAALERIPAAVEGDGRLTIRQLMERLNAARRREPLVVEGGQKIHLVQIKLNQEALELMELQGMTESSIPKVGEVVRLRYSANFSLGGSVRNCLAEVNPANRKLIETAADLFQLDIAGIDVISTDIRQPIKGSGGVICEINGMPGVLPHMLAEPHRRLLEETALNLLRSKPRQVPLMAIHGAGADALALRLEPELLDHFPGLALATRTLWRQAGDPTMLNRVSPFQRHRQVLEDPSADAFLLEIDTRNLLDSGLAWTYTDLLILLEDETEPLDPTWERWLVDNAQTVLAVPPRTARLQALTGNQPVAIAGESQLGAELLLGHLPAPHHHGTDEPPS